MKIKLLVFAVMAMFFMSCSNDNDNEPVVQQEENPLHKKWYFVSFDIENSYHEEHKNYFTCAKDYVEFFPNGIQKEVYITGCDGGTNQANEYELSILIPLMII